MANISTELDTIKNSIYGSQIRGSIYSALYKLAKDSNGGVTVTQEEYDFLPDDKLTDDVTYYISDKGTIIRNGVNYGGESSASKPVSVALAAETPAVRSIAAWATLDGWTYVQDSDNDAKITSTQSLCIGQDCYLVAAAMYRGSDITLAQEGWTKIADSQVTANTAQRIAVWGRAATAGAYTVTVTQPSSARMGLKLFALAGASGITVVDNVLISAFPFTAPATTGKRRLYLASSVFALSNSISVRTADSSLQSVEEQRYSAFYDSRTVSGIESVFTTPISDYTANTANIITLDIEEA